MAQAAPFTLKIGRSTPLPRICKIYSMCKALRKTLATQHGGRSGSTHLACGRTRGSQSSGRGESNTRKSTREAGLTGLHGDQSMLDIAASDLMVERRLRDLQLSSETYITLYQVKYYAIYIGNR